MNDQSQESAVEAGWVYLRSLRRVATRINVLSRDLAQSLDLTHLQAIALLAVRDRPGINQSILVRMMDSDANTVSGIVRRLETKKLLVRTSKTEDARAYLLSLSTKGEDCAAQAQSAFDELAEAIGQTLPRRGQDSIHSWLKAVTEIRDFAMS